VLQVLHLLQLMQLHVLPLLQQQILLLLVLQLLQLMMLLLLLVQLVLLVLLVLVVMELMQLPMELVHLWFWLDISRCLASSKGFFCAQQALQKVEFQLSGLLVNFAKPWTIPCLYWLKGIWSIQVASSLRVEFSSKICQSRRTLAKAHCS
jgi:hypothetical protein